MKNKITVLVVFIISTIILTACSKMGKVLPTEKSFALKSSGINTATKTVSAPVIYFTGSTTDVSPVAKPGLILMGGGTDVDAAVKWFLQRANGGDVVVIRATGTNGYNQYMYNMVPVNSVQTIIIDSRDKAALPDVVQRIRNAEALFIAGGDQWDYVNYWKNTPTADAINYLINTKKVTVGGTSAGLAILGSTYFSAQNGSVTSAQALSNPYNSYMTFGSNDFIASPWMQNTITDTHYTQRDRQGRHITLMARMMKDLAYTAIKGIGVDEQTAVCVDETGLGKVFGINQAYFLQNANLGAETCAGGLPLTWNRSQLAVKAYKITGTLTGNGIFNANTWALAGGTAFNYYVNNGVLVQN